MENVPPTTLLSKETGAARAGDDVFGRWPSQGRCHQVVLCSSVRRTGSRSGFLTGSDLPCR